MKKTLFSLFLLLPLTLLAKGDDSKYLAGSVPEVDGQICFQKSFRVPGKSSEQIQTTIASWLQQLVEQSIPAPGRYARIMESNDTQVVARVCEWLVFKKKPLNLDRARLRYQIISQVDGDRVTLSATSLYYYYNENMETEQGQLIKAEEWISDKEALNKTQTKLYPKSGKFRRKTIDYMETLFNTAMDIFEMQQETAPTQQKRRNVIE